MICKLSDLIQEFQEAVARKEYKKIPYSEWCDLKERAKVWDSVYVNRDFLARNVEMSRYNLLTSETIYFEFEYPFGRFLWDKLKKIHDEELATATKAMKESFSNFAETAKSTTTNLATTTSIIKKTYLQVNDETIEEIIENRKEKNNMDLIKNFDFGSCKNDNVKVSMYGIAVKNAAGTWVSYDSKTGNIIDVDILNFDGKYLYKMPVAIKDVAVGDTVIHNRKPVFISKIEGGKILAIDPAAGEEKVIILTKNMFGFDFVTKVVNLFSNFMNGATADSPFGNMLPLMLMSEGKTDDMLPLMFLMNGGKMDMSNPMMMYFLMKDGKAGNDMLPFLMMSNFQNSLGKCSCTCDCESAN